MSRVREDPPVPAAPHADSSSGCPGSPPAPPPRGRLTGRPVPPPVTDRAAARARFGIGPGEVCVLVFGGSLGARSINEAAIEAFAGAPFRVLHAAGARDYAE